MRRAIGALVSAALTACVGLSPAAKRIKVVSKPEVSDCRFLSVVYGGKQPGDLNPKGTALHTAASRGATHVVTLFHQAGKYTGDAYDCGAAPAVATNPPPEAEPVVASTTAPMPVAPATKQQWVVAVMNVESQTNRLDKQLLVNVGSQLRIAIATSGVRTVDRGALDEQIREMKGDSYGACYDDKCQIELGKALAASHILRTQVTRFGRVCVLNGELIELRAEVTVGAASSRGDCTDEGFLAMIDEVAKKLVAKS